MFYFGLKKKNAISHFISSFLSEAFSLSIILLLLHPLLMIFFSHYSPMLVRIRYKHIFQSWIYKCIFNPIRIKKKLILIGSVTSKWALISIYRLFGWSVGRSVSPKKSYIFLISSYRSLLFLHAIFLGSSEP